MNERTVYQHDVVGLYVGRTIALESPLEPGVFHLPAGCTTVEPPVAGPKEAAVWNGTEWSVVADRRGETWFDGQTPVVVNFVGDPATRGLSADAPPPPEPTLDEQLASIEAAFDAKKLALAEQLSTVMLVDGPTEAAKIAELKTAYVAACDEKAAAIDALLFGEL